ncbi:hypothetical protein L914_06348 [Plasmopara halstedii]|uniref:Dienelactone hydrolase domain-containing protein n=1 Tax=Plasmopara halstedii TaxID=4781 RepID=A0A0P1AFY6_PLAHL|nr:hypothetical protein L914_06348 [Plasmopara halstedii]CEG39348.1 hypothetical protein L914_06348 [Plasmopara halstedii]|eukprot:XP_024575717.1 hypothetical protein L914_06348 [Plasmopara halstedii]
MSASGIVRPRLVFPGAGYTLQIPVEHSPTYNHGLKNAPSLGKALVEAYFVTPASHIGRVVTGVVFVAEQSRASRTFAAQTESTDRFGRTAISFADKLAEQGYKVLVIDFFQEGKMVSAMQEHVFIIDQAANYLRQQHNIQRVGLFGVGMGADLAIKVAIEQSAAVDCVIAMCPRGIMSWTACEKSSDDISKSPTVPLLLQFGEKSPYAASEAYKKILNLCAAKPQTSPALKTSPFVNQHSGFAFSNITDEDAATQAIAEILDWLVQHLHRFQVAAATSDTDPWWPQGRNGPFFNVGLRTWQESRANWLLATQARPPRPPPVPAHLLFDGLSSVRRTFDLPQRMHLGDVIELFAEIWEVQH